MKHYKDIVFYTYEDLFILNWSIILNVHWCYLSNCATRYIADTEQITIPIKWRTAELELAIKLS